MGYLEHFHLEREPFTNAPVSEFYYDSDQHRQALIRLRHAAEHMKGLALLVGQIGAGKTTLARRMLDAFPEKDFEAALLVMIHSGISATWLLQRIALQIGVARPGKEKIELLGQIYKRLVEIHNEGRKTVVLIDEAQMLDSKEIMEEFRGLLNLEVPGKKLISFIFFGLPEIEANLELDPPLLQRVAMRFFLGGLDLPATSAYILHRMRLCGGPPEIFSKKALQAIFAYTQGTPRLINTLCDNLLFEAFLGQRTQIGSKHVVEAATNLGLGGKLKKSSLPSQVTDAPFEPETTLAPEPEPEFEISLDTDSLNNEITPYRGPVKEANTGVDLASLTPNQLIDGDDAIASSVLDTENQVVAKPQPKKSVPVDLPPDPPPDQDPRWSGPLPVFNPPPEALPKPVQQTVVETKPANLPDTQEIPEPKILIKPEPQTAPPSKTVVPTESQPVESTMLSTDEEHTTVASKEALAPPPPSIPPKFDVSLSYEDEKSLAGDSEYERRESAGDIPEDLDRLLEGLLDKM